MRPVPLILALVPAVFAFEKLTNSNGTAPYQLKTGPLDTDWTATVGTSPWPEYPRPQLARSEWKNLNGVWQYRNSTTDDRNTPPFGQNLEQSVLVPFCLESALSGIMGTDAFYSWYRTTFDVPFSWISSEKRTLLNFGAVDYQSVVYVNGKVVGNNTGGYLHFAVDVTEYLNTNATNELLMFIWDPTNSADNVIPLGKQRLNPNHIFYTPCSGIWQTVWLESAGNEYIMQLDVAADMDGKVNVTVHTNPNSTSIYEITIYEPNSTSIAAQETGTVNKPFIFEVDHPDLWSPESPTLYNIEIKLGSDTVRSYTGFRTISRGVIDTIERPLLNGEFEFLFGPLDQGFWPDGLYAPPSVEAMVYDLKVLKEVGFNMVRKHIKVEPGLFYRACDELGLMVIQDMPSLTTYSSPEIDCGPGLTTNPQQQQDFESQLGRMVEQLKSHPSIVAWVIFNEGWGQGRDDVGTDDRLTAMVRSLDPTRLIDTVTGWWDHGAGDFSDNHHYSGAQCGAPFYSTASSPYDDRRIGFQGEFGGIGLNTTADHLWKDAAAIATINQTYEMTESLWAWNYRIHRTLADLEDQVARFSCSGAVYTQTSDVEGEVNGLLTYDRRINRMDKEQWKDDIQAIYEAARKRGTTPDGKKSRRSRAVEKIRDGGMMEKMVGI